MVVQIAGGARRTVIGLLSGEAWRGQENLPDACTRCKEQAWQSRWHWEHQVKFTAVDSLPGCKHSPYFPLFTSIFPPLPYYNYKFPLSFSSLFSHEFPSHKTAPIYISSVFLSHIFTTFLHLLLLDQAVSLIQQRIWHVISEVYSPHFSYSLQ